jgi:hypothetical protein
MRVVPEAGTKKMQLEHVLACQALARARGIDRSLLGPMLLIERSRLTSRTTSLRYIYESQEGRIMLILWKVTQGKPPG